MGSDSSKFMPTRDKDSDRVKKLAMGEPATAGWLAPTYLLWSKTNDARKSMNPSTDVPPTAPKAEKPADPKPITPATTEQLRGIRYRQRMGRSSTILSTQSMGTSTGQSNRPLLGG